MKRYDWRAEFQKFIDMKQELKQLYGDQFCGFSGRHRARYLPGDVPFHIISRIAQGRWLLTPGPQLNRIIAGVVGRAQSLPQFGGVKVHAMVFMSNHLHLLVQGEGKQLSDFVGYIKRELSYRWGSLRIDWIGAMWSEFLATALPTAKSQLICLKYILSHGVKEGIVSKPHLWPGIHSAKQLLRGSRLVGEWFNGTEYGRACDVEARKKNPRPVRMASYYVKYEVHLTVLPALSHLDEAQRRAYLQKMAAEIEEEGRLARNGKRPLGAKAAMTAPRETRTDLPPQPWFEQRKNMVCWADPRDPETVAYIKAHWAFQKAFKQASEALKLGSREVAFPPLAFVPMQYRADLPT